MDSKENFKCFSSETANKDIHHECDGGIEKTVPRNTDCHQEACPVMTNGDHGGRIFLSHPYSNNEFFFLVNMKYRILSFEKHKKVPEYTDVRHTYEMVTSF